MLIPHALVFVLFFLIQNNFYQHSLSQNSLNHGREMLDSRMVTHLDVYMAVFWLENVCIFCFYTRCDHFRSGSIIWNNHKSRYLLFYKYIVLEKIITLSILNSFYNGGLQ